MKKKKNLEKPTIKTKIEAKNKRYGAIKDFSRKPFISEPTESTMHDPSEYNDCHRSEESVERKHFIILKKDNLVLNTNSEIMQNNSISDFVQSRNVSRINHRKTDPITINQSLDDTPDMLSKRTVYKQQAKIKNQSSDQKLDNLKKQILQGSRQNFHGLDKEQFYSDISKPYPYNLASLSHVLPRKSQKNINFAVFESKSFSP